MAVTSQDVLAALCVLGPDSVLLRRLSQDTHPRLKAAMYAQVGHTGERNMPPVLFTEAVQVNVFFYTQLSF